MDVISVAMLIFVSHATKSAECSNDDVVALAGFNVSLNWTLQTPGQITDTFRISNSLGNKMAEFSGWMCTVNDNKTYSCNIINATDRWVFSLTIFSVTAIQSDNYTLKHLRRFKEIGNASIKLVVIDGPDNITLSRTESDFYLKEDEIFTIDCSAHCYPGCIFWWKGNNTIESEQLNIRFESGKAGQYTCYVMNPLTNITLKSNSITLHHQGKEDKHKEEVLIAVSAIGIAAAVVLLVVIGSMLVIKWRKNASNKTEKELSTAYQND